MIEALHLLPAIVCGVVALFLVQTISEDIATGARPWRSREMAAGTVSAALAAASAAISAWPLLAAVIREATQ